MSEPNPATGVQRISRDPVARERTASAFVDVDAACVAGDRVRGQDGASATVDLNSASCISGNCVPTHCAGSAVIKADAGAGVRRDRVRREDASIAAGKETNARSSVVQNNAAAHRRRRVDAYRIVSTQAVVVDGVADETMSRPTANMTALVGLKQVEASRR